MFKRWLVGSVAALVVMLSVASDADAQRRGRGGIGISLGSGYGPNLNYGWGGSGFNYGYGGYDGRNYNPNWGYSKYPGYYGRSGFNYGYNNPSFNYGRSGYYPQYYSYSTPGSYFPSTYYSDPSPGTYITGSMPVFDPTRPGAAITMRPATSTSSYTPQGNEAMVELRVPEPNAEVFIDGRATQQRGTERQFVSPPLESKGTYAVRVRWRDASGMHDVMRTVAVTPGETSRTDFNVSLVGDRTGEELAEPPTRLPRETAPQPRNRDDD